MRSQRRCAIRAAGLRKPKSSSGKLLIAALALASVAACERGAPAPTDELRRDLELARGQGLELAPRGSGQSIVSAAELIPQSAKTVSSASRAPKKTPVVAVKPKAATVAEAPQPTPERSTEPAPAPDPVRPQPAARPAMNPAPPGGYKSMGELIRKAPFPINP